MGTILGRFFLPHPPTAIPEVGKENTAYLKRTAESLDAAGKAIAELCPDTVVVLTQRGPRFNDHYYMPSPKRVSGDFAPFGNKRLILGFDNDTDLAEAIGKKAEEFQLSAGFVDDIIMKKRGIPYDLDYSITVPLYFICRYCTSFKILPISLGGLGGKDQYRFGMALRNALAESGKNTVILGSGALSHRLPSEIPQETSMGDGLLGKFMNKVFHLHPTEAPKNVSKDGAAFDETFRKLLLHEDIEGFLDFDPRLKENADQYGLDVFRVLLGTLDGFDFVPRILSYEAPTGIGYMAAELTCGKPKESFYFHRLAEKEKNDSDFITEETDDVIKLAYLALQTAVAKGKEAEVPKDTPNHLKERRGGVYVTLENDGRILGRRGTTEANQPGLAEEILYNTYCAAMQAPSLTASELNDITITVDILTRPVDITDESQTDPALYGIIAEHHGKIGVILPDEIGIDTAEEQLQAALASAGIHPWASWNLKRFTVTRFRSK